MANLTSSTATDQLVPDQQSNEPRSSTWVRDAIRFVVAAALPAIVVIVAMVAVAGRSGIEKGLTRFIQPDAFFWLVLSGLVGMLWKKADRGTMLITLLIWLGYTVVASPLLTDAVYRRLEGPYLKLRPLERKTPLELIVVLGGGTEVGGNGEPQLGVSGDRVMVAARMILTGRAERIICTGAPIAGLSRPGEMTGAEQTIAMLRDLGVPEEKIVQVGGRTTREEMLAIRELLQPTGEGEPTETLGIVTSAWHLPRAMRLARSVGIEAEPIPADFRTGTGWITPLKFVPSSDSAYQLGAAVKELIAGWVGR